MKHYKHYIYLSILILLHNPHFTFSQINRFEFENYTPIWSHYSGGEGLSSNIQALTTTPYPIITKEHLYVTANILDKTTLNGHLSEKIDIRTGERIWSNFQYSIAPNTREYAQSPYLENGSYKVYIYKEIKTPPSGPLSIFWSKSILMKRNYDEVSGIEMDSLVTDSLDKKNTLLNVPESIVTNLKTILAKEGNNSRYTKVAPVGIDYLFTSVVLNEFGHIIDSVGLRIMRATFAPKQIRTVPVGVDSNLFQISSQNSTDSQSVQIVLMDKQLHILQNKEIIDLLPPQFEDHILIKTIENGFYVMSSRNKDIDNLYDIVISKFNYEMELQESFTFEKAPQSIGLIELPDGKTLSSFVKEENGFSNLYFYKSNGHGEVSIVKKLKCKKNNDQLFVRSLYLTKDNDLLMNITHVDDNSIITPLPKWNNWTLFDGKSLGITSSISTLQLSRPKLYPNPVSDLLVIETTLIYNEIEIINIDGTLSKKEANAVKYIDVSSLPNGMYICNLKDNGKSIGQQRFIKIK
ncbi:MAG TPA: T9SS type A sorting domain-containing protein [Saprospiraceae bacterium]|jgi:hypothetical protein|nr:T9SS type A sorting domain-containing protein [Saprospiraceae bacterium]